jgi:hypothetical protein
MPDFPTQVYLKINYQPNAILSGATQDADPGNVSNPNIDPHFATTWSITCSYPGRDDIGEITIVLNHDNTVQSVHMWIQPRSAADKAQWYEFTATDGFSNLGDFSEVFINGMSWTEGPDGAPQEDPPIVSTISGMPKDAEDKDYSE